VARGKDRGLALKEVRQQRYYSNQICKYGNFLYRKGQSVYADCIILGKLSEKHG